MKETSNSNRSKLFSVKWWKFHIGRKLILTQKACKEICREEHGIFRMTSTNRRTGNLSYAHYLCSFQGDSSCNFHVFRKFFS